MRNLKSVLGVWMAAVIFAAYDAGSMNLVQNPGFEEADANGKPAAWSVWSGPDAVAVTSLSFKGKNALMVRVPDKVTWRVAQTMPVPRPGKYDLDFFTRIRGDAQFNVIWAFEDKDGNPIAVSRYWTRFFREAQAASWTPVKTKIEAPAGAVKIIITFFCNMVEGGREGFVFLDEVSLVCIEDSDVTGDAMPEGAKLVLQEDFSSGRIPSGWEAAGGDWKVENDALAGEKGMIFHTGEVGSPNMRVEYTAWSNEERPCDLSAILSARALASWSQVNGYFFGFGSQFNTKNSIARRTPGTEILTEKGGALEVFEDGIRPGVKHKVVVQRDYNELKLFVDGRLLLEANDPFYASRTGGVFGFYLWGPGFIDDVRVYALPWEIGECVSEREIEFQMHEGFEGAVAGEEYAGFREEAGGADLRVVDRPTWIYKEPMGNEFVKDNCLEIRAAAPDANIKLSQSFDPLNSGIVEFDILVEEHGELEFSISGADGAEIINLIISKDGRFMTEDAQGRRALRETMRYQRRVFDADFRLMKNMWHTFRLQFTDGLRQIVILDHYSEIAGDFPLGNQGDYLPLGSVNTVTPAGDNNGKAVSFSISAAGKTLLYLDNLVIFGPLGTDTVRGQPLTHSAANLLGLDFPPRKDPFSLKIQSYRHLTRNNMRITPMFRHFGDKSAEYKIFKPAGGLYNQALVDLVFIEEKINMLHRTAAYMAHTEPGGKLDGQLAKLNVMYQDAERLQEQALNAYANAYLDNQDGGKLAGFHAVMESVMEKHDNINADIENCLRTLMPSAASKDIIPCPAPLEKGGIKWNRANKRWENNGAPVVYNYFSFGPDNRFYQDDLEILGFQNCRRDMGCNYKRFPGGANDPPIEEAGKYINPADGNWSWLKRLRDSNRAGLMMAAAGLNYAVTGAPKWWYEKYKDQDVVFTTDSGAASGNHAWRGMYALNWWHPEVIKLIDEQFTAVGHEAAQYKDAINLIQIGWELKNCLPGGLTPGYNKSAIKAFHAELEKKYGAVDNLNRLWNTNYSSLDEIVPPRGLTKPSGLQYEFRKFLHDGFTGWLKSISDALHKHIPDIPTSSDSQYTLGGRLFAEAIDPVGFFRAMDIKLYHTYQDWDRKFVDRWHAQLSEALGTPWGTKEWAISQGCPYMFQTDKMRNNGLREKAMLMMWGGAMPEYYGISSLGNWQYTTGGVEPRLDRLVFTYIAPFYALYMERTRRLGHSALTMPLAKPELGILETTSSYYNGLGVREGMRAIAIELTELGWNFEFLYEQLLQENLQHLEGTELLFVPSGLCMNDELADALYAWVAAGGVMFCVGGPAGIWNEYGRTGDRLEDIFKVAWTNTDGRWELPGVEAFYEGAGVKAWRADHGKGRVIVFDNLNKSVFELMPQFAERRFGCDNPAIQFCMREGDGVKYLYALNWSVDETAEAVVFLKGHFDSIVDEGLQLPMEVPHYEEGGRTFFKTRLAPAAVTLFRIK